MSWVQSYFVLESWLKSRQFTTRAVLSTNIECKNERMQINGSSSSTNECVYGKLGNQIGKKHYTTRKLNNMLLKTNGLMRKSKRKSENTLRQIAINLKKCMGCSKSSSKRNVHEDIGLPPGAQKIQINNLTFHIKNQKKNKQNAVSRRKERKKIRE